MKNLADAVLEFFEFLYFSDEETLNFDDAAKRSEALVDAVENDFTDEEKQALMQAAQRRLDSINARNAESGTTNSEPSDLEGFLKHTAAGRFSITGFGEDDYDE